MTVQWRTDFPGGNGLLLDLQEQKGLCVLRFASEPKNCPQAMWWHFAVRGLAGRTARIVLGNPEQTLGGWDWSKNRPVCRRGDGPWGRIGPPERVECPDGRVEWAWDIQPAPPAGKPGPDGGKAGPKRGGNGIEVAHCFPYQLADLEATLGDLGGVFQQTAIGVTYQNRPLPRVFNSPPDKGRPGVYLTARHHAGETPGSWVLDGLLRHVGGDRRLYDSIAWWAVPIVDLDDVIAGSYGKDPFPHDCNRAYGLAGPRRPEASAIVPDVRRFKDAAKALFFADIHAPAHAEQACYVPLRGWEADSPINPIAEEFANRFNAAQPEDLRSPIAHITPEAGTNTRYAGMSSSRWVSEMLHADALSAEISYQGNGKTYYTIEDYRRLGAALAETIAQWVTK